MTIIKETDTYIAKTSTGKNKYWKGLIFKNGNTYSTGSEFWQENGKHTISTPTEAKPKNVGKKNETTSEIQANLELESTIELKIKKGYNLESNNDSPIVRLDKPMLAHSYRDRSHNIIYPVAVQPKYNGCRCLYNSDIGPYSREGNYFIKEIFDHLKFDTKGYKFDGELMVPGKYLQESMEYVKKYRKESKELCYFIYDVMIENLGFTDRFNFIENFFKNFNHKQIFIAPTIVVKNETQMMEKHKLFESQGYEGIILRNLNGLYKKGYRSKDLQKYKTEIDGEFIIVGAKEGQGSYKGSIVFICETPAKETFEVKPKGSRDYTQNLWTVFTNTPKKIIGKKLTVTYNELTKLGKPRNPVGKVIRDYE